MVTIIRKKFGREYWLTIEGMVGYCKDILEYLFICFEDVQYFIKQGSHSLMLIFLGSKQDFSIN
jgi:hypothetical protein